MEDLPLGRIAVLVPEFAVKDLPLGRTLMMMMIGPIGLHVVKSLQKNVECFTSKPNAHGTFRNLDFKIMEWLTR